MLWPFFGFIYCVVRFFCDVWNERTVPIFMVTEMVQVDAEVMFWYHIHFLPPHQFSIHLNQLIHTEVEAV